MRSRLLLVPCVALLALGGTRARGDQGVLDGVPHVRQKHDLSGEACVEMWARKLGKALAQENVFDESGTDPAAGRGSRPRELVAALSKLGFKAVPAWRSGSSKPSEQELASAYGSLEADLERGVPSIVLLRDEDRETSRGSFRLVIGRDATAGEVVLHDPSREDGARTKLKKDAFLSRWPVTEAGEQSLVRIPLEADRIVEPKKAPGFTPYDYARHVMSRKEELGDDAAAFAVVIEPPFVVFGDEALAGVRVHAEHTVRWAVSKLKQDFFEHDPESLLEIWLFKDKESYEGNAKRIFGDTPTTKFGYFSPSHGALIMNISTGGGTLVHEIVHPFVSANVRDCPTWLNEGLGSLFEQSADRDGHIVGLTNWRLAGLQKAIRAGELPSFEKLASLPPGEFYGKDAGTNYAQARYLLYYLQEKSLLGKFWKEILGSRKEDPTGYASLKKTLGEDDMAAFQKRWESYVAKLRFP